MQPDPSTTITEHLDNYCVCSHDAAHHYTMYDPRFGYPEDAETVYACTELGCECMNFTHQHLYLQV